MATRSGIELTHPGTSYDKRRRRPFVKEKTAIRLADAVVAMLEANRLTARDVLEAVGVSLPKKYDGLLKTGYRAGFIAAFKEKPDPEADALARAFAIFEAMRTHPGKMRTFLKQRMKE